MSAPPDGILVIGEFSSTLILRHKPSSKTFKSQTVHTPEDLHKIRPQLKGKSFYILLNTLDQSFHHETFPDLKLLDRRPFLKNRLKALQENESLSGIYQAKGATESYTLCMAHKTQRLQAWILALESLPLVVKKVFLLPLEGCLLLKQKTLLQPKENSQTPSDKWTILITNHALNGIRLSAFYNEHFRFTRLVPPPSDNSPWYQNLAAEIQGTRSYIHHLLDHTDASLDVCIWGEASCLQHIPATLEGIHKIYKFMGTQNGDQLYGETLFKTWKLFPRKSRLTLSLSPAARTPRTFITQKLLHPLLGTICMIGCLSWAGFWGYECWQRYQSIHTLQKRLEIFKMQRPEGSYTAEPTRVTK